MLTYWDYCYLLLQYIMMFTKNLFIDFIVQKNLYHFHCYNNNNNNELENKITICVYIHVITHYQTIAR